MQHVFYTDKQNLNLFVLSFVCSKRQAVPQPLGLLKESLQFSTQKWKLRESQWVHLSPVISNPLPDARLWLMFMHKHLANNVIVYSLHKGRGQKWRWAVMSGCISHLSWGFILGVLQPVFAIFHDKNQEEWDPRWLCGVSEGSAFLGSGLCL